MNTTDIIEKLHSHHTEFTNYISELDDRSFFIPPSAGAWSAAQHADHIRRSLAPLATGLKFPKWMIRWIAPKANRPSKDYDKLVIKYLHKLEGGGRAIGRFIPAKTDSIDKKIVTGTIQKHVSTICNALQKFSEGDLDKIVLPHPLLGKITLREMMFFTIYHVQHHLEITKRNLLKF